MAWFGRKKSVDPEKIQPGLALVPQLEGPGFILRATSAPAGFKSRSLATVAEIRFELGAGWFHQDDLQRFFDRKNSIAESWNGSDTELFLCMVSGVAKGSMADKALSAQAGLPADSAVLLRPAIDGLEIVLLLDSLQLERISVWLQAVPKL
ncbi:hypothetical protein ACT3UD_09775 [Glutamicibacter sp. 287]|uniref:hypothetical protein n=1 Tax=unclassified Glutamicibacter TaxID=2627139 RepID=UPI000BB6FCC6|nr:hypothetical protein [Glutamicibacter sp. BW80]PCC29020.1 hypothetical protein CIK76_10010 [Glutamicibacter sp. BW80]